MRTNSGKSGLEKLSTIFCQAVADGDPDEAANECQHERFDQELKQDVAAVRADGFAQADLSCTLGHGYEHDVHNADTADQEAYGADAGE